MANPLANEHYGPTLQVIAHLLSARSVSLFLTEPEPPLRLRLTSTTDSSLTELVLDIPEEAPPGEYATISFARECYLDEQMEASRILPGKNKAMFSERKCSADPGDSGRTASQFAIPLRHRRHKFLGLLVAEEKISNGTISDFGEADRAYAPAVKDLVERTVHQARITEIFEDFRDRVSLTNEIAELYDTILRHGAVLLGADRGDFIAPSLQTGQPVCQRHFGPKPEANILNKPPSEGSFVYHVMLSDLPFQINNNVHNSPHYEQIDSRTKSELAYQFVTPQNKRLLLNLESFRGGYFEPNDGNTLGLLMRYVAALVAQREAEDVVALFDRLFIANLGEDVFIKDPAGRFVFVNPGFVPRFGRKDLWQIIGKTDFEIFGTGTNFASEVREDDMRVMRTGEPSDWFYEHFPEVGPTPGGLIRTRKFPIAYDPVVQSYMERVLAEVIAPLSRDDGSRCLGVLGITHKVADTADFVEIEEFAKSAGLIWRRDGNHCQTTQALGTLLDIKDNRDIHGAKLPPKVVLGTLRELLDAESQATLDAEISKVRRRVESGADPAFPAEPIVSGGALILRLRGDQRAIGLRYKYRRPVAQNPKSDILIAVLQDVSAEIKTNEWLRRGIRHLAYSGLYRAAIHEARRPITAVPDVTGELIEQIKSLPEKPMDKIREGLLEIQEELIQMSEDCRDASGIVDTLSELSTRDADLPLACLDFGEMYAKVASKVGAEARDKLQTLKENGHSEVVNTEIECPLLEVDPAKYVMAHDHALAVSLSILLENALIYGAGFGKEAAIRIRVKEELGSGKAGESPKYVVIEIVDFGPGFSPNVLTHSRDLFSVDIKKNFLGVGIAIAKTLIQGMKGQLDLQNWHDAASGTSGGLARISLLAGEIPIEPPMTSREATIV